MTEHNIRSDPMLRQLAAAVARAMLSTEQQAQLRAPVQRDVQIQRYLRARRKRRDLLGADIFADPAWDILLDLYVSQLRGRRVSVSSACIAGNVPATTALRYIKMLCDEGLIERVPDADDNRRIWVQLKPKAQAGIEAVFDQMLDIS